LTAGTRLVREWRGVTYTVLVHADGFEWNDRRYRSLTIVAREITGARWSGPRFFGLRKHAGCSVASAENMRKPDRPKSGVVFRCALYTRKSSDDGLEQEFPSIKIQPKRSTSAPRSANAAGNVL
jgi:hypothetical protein